LNRLGFILDSRGLKNATARAIQVWKRFGLTSYRMEKRLTAYAEMVMAYGTCPSLPITAAVLDRNPAAARRLADLGVELCVHGFVHTDMSKLAPEIQREHIERAVDIFKKHEIAYSGFRSPYLKYNQATLEAVEAAGFLYDSNLPFFWEPPSLSTLTPQQADGLSRGLRFYHPVKYPEERSLPRFANRIVEIPVSLPDDEILLDRMGLRPKAIGPIWREMAEMALGREELLTIQLHPERIIMLREGLKHVLDFTHSNGSFWLATMRDIARWWRERTMARVVVESAGSGRYRVTDLEPDRCRLVVVEPVNGTERTIEPGQEIRCDLKPVIGVLPETDEHLINEFRESGYVIEVTQDVRSNALCLDGDHPTMPRERIDAARGSLLRIAAWPRPFKAACAVTGDIDCLTLGDFIRRFGED
jgi:peptidoglycan/xylan/chitin deacetylase (PgdA/CDA1 family)